jgi:transglutaminase-like putative cysteine protease
MDTSLSQRTLVWMLPAAALAGLPHWLHVPASLASFFTLMLLWRIVACWRKQWFSFATKLLGVVLLAGLFLLYLAHSGEWGRDSGSGIFLVALGLKLFELNKPRDLYLTAYLTLVVVATQFLYDQSIAVAALGLVVLMMIANALLSLHTRAHGRRMVVLGWRLFASALPFTLLMFVLFPRFQAPSWMMLKGDRHSAHSGLRDTLRPGEINELLLSPKLAFRVKFFGNAPPRNQLYWRGPVFSFIDGDNWRISQSEFVTRFQDEVRFDGPRYEYTLLQEPQDQPWVYALDLPDSFPAGVQRNGNYQLVAQGKQGKANEFVLSSRPTYNTGYITKVEYRENRQLPYEPSQEVNDLVKRLEGNGDPERYIKNVLAHFQNDGYRYTLRPPLLADRKLEHFLLESKQGYCEHFATAFVYLMRVADLPARVVTGYQGGQYNAVGQFYEIRNALAHAWAEVWLDGKGWTRIDPTIAVLPSRIEYPVNVTTQVNTGNVVVSSSKGANELEAASSVELVTEFWDNFEYQWQRWIIRYGSEEQQSALNLIGLKKTGAIVFWGLYALILVAFAVSVWIWRPRFFQDDPVIKQYQRFLNKMAKRGVKINVGEGPSAFAQRAKQTLPNSSELIETITRCYIRLRYQRSSSEHDFQLMKISIRKFP